VQEFIHGLKSDTYFFTSMLPIYGSDLSKFTSGAGKTKEEAYKDYINAWLASSSII
jgi:hypothetical protein